MKFNIMNELMNRKGGHRAARAAKNSDTRSPSKGEYIDMECGLCSVLFPFFS